MKTVFENYLSNLIRPGERVLNPFSTVDDLKNHLHGLIKGSKLLTTLFESLSLHEENNFKNYVLVDSFSRIMKKAAVKIDVSKIPSSDCYNGNDHTYQISDPEGDFDYLINFRGPREKFNIVVYKFLKKPNKNDDDFYFWRMVGGEGITCSEMLDDFIDNANNIQGDKQLTINLLKERFSLIINLMLYINSGEPDLREHKGKSKKGIDFNGRKRESKIRKYKDETFNNYTMVGINFKKITEVDPYVKWQHYGSRNSLRRLQIISGHNKSGTNLSNLQRTSNEKN